MPLNTLTVAAVTTPTVIGTLFSHYLDRKSLKGSPKAHLSYHEGIELIRRFMLWASHNPLEHLQIFTAQYVPHPVWTHTEEVVIPEEFLDHSAAHLTKHLGPDGVEKVGGKSWWRWRSRQLQAEYIEMRQDYRYRLKHPEETKRTMLYIHGGAYYFGSVDEHRYQMQRHARKLKARVLAPRYRLAPQFPFPCGMYDVLACYLYLLSQQPPESIIIAGDSAGGGMAVSILLILRDQGIPLPAGGVLISPWLDLTHSFPSVMADNSRDYIPSHGFLHKPSATWPPPTESELAAIQNNDAVPPKAAAKEEALGYTTHTPPPEQSQEQHGKPAVKLSKNSSILMDGRIVTIEDQIQVYTTNALMDFPLVSPIIQGSLGGLCPLLVLTGGGEVLRDEQVYFAHKAANPSLYSTWQGHIDADPSGRQQAAVIDERFSDGTKVFLQVHDDCCHVVPTLSWTLPAKLMFRTVAHFSAWALSQAQKIKIEVPPDDDISIITTTSSSSSNDGEVPASPSHARTVKEASVMPYLPPFEGNMVRQRVDPKGRLFILPPPEEIPALQMPPEEIGVIKSGPVKRWMEAKNKWDTRFAQAKLEVQRRRAKEMSEGYDRGGLEDNERPPPSALVGRRRKGKLGGKAEDVAAGGWGKKSWGLGFWGMMGGSHDENTIKRGEKADEKTAKRGERSTARDRQME